MWRDDHLCVLWCLMSWGRSISVRQCSHSTLPCTDGGSEALSWSPFLPLWATNATYNVSQSRPQPASCAHRAPRTSASRQRWWWRAIRLNISKYLYIKHKDTHYFQIQTNFWRKLYQIQTNFDENWYQIQTNFDIITYQIQTYFEENRIKTKPTLKEYTIPRRTVQIILLCF